MRSPDWTEEFEPRIDQLRPPTPTGCLVDGDILIKNKTTPIVEEAELPPTPGRGVLAELEIAESDEINEVLFLSSANCELAAAQVDSPLASCDAYEEMPETPGEEEDSERIAYNSERAPATPGRGVAEDTTMETSDVLPLSCNPYITPPKTPGRDIVLPLRAHERQTQAKVASSPSPHPNLLRISPTAMSSPCSLAEASSDTDDWTRAKPLQGLENMPGVQNEEPSSGKHKQWKKLKRKKRNQQKQLGRSFFSNAGLQRWRSLYEEWKIFHSFWKHGLDEEDARYLKVSYEKLWEEGKCAEWLRNTTWISHPHILFY